MKNFLYSLTIFIVCNFFFYLFAVSLWGQFAPAFLKPNINYRIGSYGHMYTRLKEIKQIDSIDILFLGSSHAYRGFDNRIFKEKGFTSFNLGSSAQTPIQTLTLLERYLDKIHPKSIIFEVNPLTLCSDGVESSLDIIANDTNDLHSLEMGLKVNNIKTYNTLFYALYKDLFHLNKSYIEPIKKAQDTYIHGGFVESEIAYYNKPLKSGTQKITIPQKQIEAFEKCLLKIKKRNIKVILVYAPVTHDFYSSYSNNKYFDEKMKSYSEYYNFNKIMNLTDSLYFYDTNHLNQNGVRIFNKKLIEILNNRQIIKPSKL
ncbi:D-alanyl-lipoteichoic acid biosynthesis protein DltD [Chryseobacterium sp. IT-36CA2]|uniref:D-alanyl-lipoteichoic acid biosynthesis protein DltD n=1 Tax=Chryseobacterium sp. IT-36CA2 TaxID=3026460 RepID=UPI0039DFED75